jgi:hypothetical protein
MREIRTSGSMSGDGKRGVDRASPLHARAREREGRLAGVPVARRRERVESGFRELSATTPIRSPKSVPDTVFPDRDSSKCSSISQSDALSPPVIFITQWWIVWILCTLTSLNGK